MIDVFYMCFNGDIPFTEATYPASCAMQGREHSHRPADNTSCRLATLHPPKCISADSVALGEAFSVDVQGGHCCCRASGQPIRQHSRVSSTSGLNFFCKPCKQQHAGWRTASL